MKKRYKEGRTSALEQIINKQHEELDKWKNKAVNDEFVIDSMQKERDQYVLTCKFLTDTLLILSQLEKILTKNHSLFSQCLLTAITFFKLELSKAMRTIQYDGADSYTYALSLNNNKNVNDD